MTETNEFNPCAASGCPAACCRDMVFEGLSQRDVDTLTPYGTRVIQLSAKVMAQHIEEDIYDSTTGTTVYVAPQQANTQTLSMVGPCPNLEPDNSCGVYETRPQACRNFGFASGDCATSRSYLGIPRIRKEVKKQYQASQKKKKN